MNHKNLKEQNTNPVHQPFLGQRVINPLNSNFNLPAADNENKNNPISSKCVMNRKQRKKLLNQQKERFRNKYKDKGAALLEKNKSYDIMDQFGSDNNIPKDESLHLNPLVNPRQPLVAKPKILEDKNAENSSSNEFIPPVENWYEKRKGLGTVKQNKRKKLKLKEKAETRVIPKYKNIDHEDPDPFR